MKKRGLAALMLFVCIAASYGLAQGISDTKDQPQQVKSIFSFKDELGITDDQELKLKALLYDEQTFLDSENTTLKSLGEELSKLIDAKADMQAIKSKLEEIAKVQVDVSYRNIADARQIETVLTPEQMEKWKDIQKKYSAQTHS
jgi:Spy/CpxP family protein refolding chaperone